jgi:hypothetical protein
VCFVVVDVKRISLTILRSRVAVLVRCTRLAIESGRGVWLLACEYSLCSFWSVSFGRVHMFLSSGLCMITSFCELGCCVIVVEPVGIASRLGFIGMVVQVVYIGFMPVSCGGALGGCSLGRCLMGTALLRYALIACGPDGAAMMMSWGYHMGFNSNRYVMDKMGVSSSSGCVLLIYLGLRPCLRCV